MRLASFELAQKYPAHVGYFTEYSSGGKSSRWLLSLMGIFHTLLVLFIGR